MKWQHRLPGVVASRREASTGSIEAYVRGCTDAQLADPDFVARMTVGLHWAAQEARNKMAASAELKWRRDNGVSFGWHTR